MSNANLSVAVLLSAGRHPVSGAPRACRGDAVALGLARSLGVGAVHVIHAGDAEEPALRDYLAFGAGRIEVLPVPAGFDVMPALVHRLRAIDIVIAGGRSEMGIASGLLPYALARALARPVIGNVLEAHVDDGSVQIRQFLPKGKRRAVHAPLPAVLIAHALAPVELRYAHARGVTGQISVVPVGISPDPAAEGAWSVDPDVRRAVPLKAQDRKAGHARLMSAIASEAKAGVVAIEGSCVDKAQVMLTYLREHRLVDF
jgi:electron transfer flavoprotein beta subunit